MGSCTLSHWKPGDTQQCPAPAPALGSLCRSPLPHLTRQKALRAPGTTHFGDSELSAAASTSLFPAEPPLSAVWGQKSQQCPCSGSARGHAAFRAPYQPEGPAVTLPWATFYSCDDYKSLYISANLTLPCILRSICRIR